MKILILLFLISCGQNKTGTAPKKSTYYANYNERGHIQRCKVESMQGCGLTLNCGYYGHYYCVNPRAIKYPKRKI